ncbi:MAG TPA: stage II sporulation protein M [Solirubrobacteraceae bacterium]|nr:stage II sporulation protein M [Solirubrobacteraceae bacterium]
MDADRLVLLQGLRDTRSTFERWAANPRAVLVPWLLGALAIAIALLTSVWAIAATVRPDVSTTLLAGLNAPADLDAVGRILFRNSLVLALHALACVAGFIAGASLPLQIEHKTGFSRVLHEKAGPFAIAFVTGATLFSLVTQAWVLGSIGSDVAQQLDITALTLILTLLPHAIPELVGLFLPLAAWLIASRRDEWEELLAATFVTVAIAIPLVVGAAFIEVYWWPDLLRAVSPVY